MTTFGSGIRIRSTKIEACDVTSAVHLRKHSSLGRDLAIPALDAEAPAHLEVFAVHPIRVGRIERDHICFSDLVNQIATLA